MDLNQSFAREDAFLGINSVGFGASYRNSNFDADDPEDSRGREVAVLRLNSRAEPADDVRNDTLITATFDDLDEDDDAYSRYALQGVSTVQWRPDDRPYLVTGSLRTLAERIDETNNGSPTRSETILAEFHGRAAMAGK